jgi:hypothetical protein
MFETMSACEPVPKEITLVNSYLTQFLSSIQVASEVFKTAQFRPVILTIV